MNEKQIADAVLSLCLGAFLGTVIVAAVVILVVTFRGHKKLFCFHRWEGGHGMTGDGYDCLLCGKKTYNVANLWFFHATNHVTKD